MSEAVFLKLLPIFYLMVIPAAWGVVRLYRSVSMIKFYLRKICTKMEITCGKDLD